MSRHVWNIQETSDSKGSDSVRRTYLEQRDLRRCLAQASSARRLEAACEVGCGYGRLTMVLAEYAAGVVGFEREPALVAEARRILPDLEFHTVESLVHLPAAAGTFDFAMTFTVLQHMNDPESRAAIAELKRIVGDGFILLVEETDPSLGAEFEPDAQGGITKGRAREVYEAWMEPFRLILEFPREIEPGYPRGDVGTYMLFGRLSQLGYSVRRKSDSTTNRSEFMEEHHEKNHSSSHRVPVGIPCLESGGRCPAR